MAGHEPAIKQSYVSSSPDLVAALLLSRPSPGWRRRICPPRLEPNRRTSAAAAAGLRPVAVAAPLPSNDEGEERVSTVAFHGR
ncbi:hypothetical protein QYE76_062202 [Lolium multiflorum]|uniref:Uncharacterized protein n=1 Tax=Lolium multiflorum TaxID=4521 RepID=A0AAD8S587_LOLMU|nr:hypothetical protein QYE76_062202 [Lolium multiflorum]